MKTSQQQSDFHSRSLSICLLAGEASGDAQGALLATALQSEFAKAGIRIKIWGSGGRLMHAAGVENVVHIDELSAMGFAEVLAVYPRLSAAAHKLQMNLKLRNPDITILVDYPGLNMRLMEDAFHLGSCVVYHIPPKVWAHGVGRVARLRDCTYLVTCILPFEVKLLKRAGVNVCFVGNPLNDEVQRFLHTRTKELVTNRSEIPLVGLVPGSRSGEIERIFPTLVKSFLRTRAALNGRLKAVVPVASTISRSRIEELLIHSLSEENAQSARVDIELHSEGCLLTALKDCRYAWVCSGTAALETALLGIPLSVVYKMHPLTYAVAKRLVRLPYISLVNLCAERELVPEFIQEQASVENLSAHALSILGSPAAEHHLHEQLLALQKVFPLDSARRAAHEILDCFLNLPENPQRRFHFKAVRDLWLEEKEWGISH